MHVRVRKCFCSESQLLYLMRMISEDVYLNNKNFDTDS